MEKPKTFKHPPSNASKSRKKNNGPSRTSKKSQSHPNPTRKTYNTKNRRSKTYKRISRFESKLPRIKEEPSSYMIKRKEELEMKLVCPNTSICLGFNKESQDLIKSYFENFLNFKYLEQAKVLSKGGVNGMVSLLSYDKNGYKSKVAMKSMANVDSVLGADNLFLEAYNGLAFINNYAKMYPVFVETYGAGYFKNKDDYVRVVSKREGQSIDLNENMFRILFDSNKNVDYAEMANFVANDSSKHVVFTQMVDNSKTLYWVLENEIGVACDEIYEYFESRNSINSNNFWDSNSEPSDNNENSESKALNAYKKSFFDGGSNSNNDDSNSNNNGSNSNNDGSNSNNDGSNSNNDDIDEKISDTYILLYRFIICLYQIYHALSGLRGKFAHNDLHPKNVLIYELPKKHKVREVIEYKYHETVNRKSGQVQFKTPFVPKIIDYGRCFVPGAANLIDKTMKDLDHRLIALFVGEEETVIPEAIQYTTEKYNAHVVGVELVELSKLRYILRFRNEESLKHFIDNEMKGYGMSVIQLDKGKIPYFVDVKTAHKRNKSSLKHFLREIKDALGIGFNSENESDPNEFFTSVRKYNGTKDLWLLQHVYVEFEKNLENLKKIKSPTTELQLLLNLFQSFLYRKPTNERHGGRHNPKSGLGMNQINNVKDAKSHLYVMLFIDNHLGKTYLEHYQMREIEESHTYATIDVYSRDREMDIAVSQ